MKLLVKDIDGLIFRKVKVKQVNAEIARHSPNATFQSMLYLRFSVTNVFYFRTKSF